MYKAVFKLDTMRNVWLHEPSGAALCHWRYVKDGVEVCDLAEEERVRSMAAKLVETRQLRPEGSVEAVFLSEDKPFAVSGRPVEVKMTNFGATDTKGL